MGAYPAALGKWVLLGGIIGVAGGVIGSLFHIGVNYATAIRGAHPWILYLLPVGGLAIVGLYKLCHLEGKGTNAIIESVHFGESVPILLVPVIFVSTVMRVREKNLVCVVHEMLCHGQKQPVLIVRACASDRGPCGLCFLQNFACGHFVSSCVKNRVPTCLPSMIS